MVKWMFGSLLCTVLAVPVDDSCAIGKLLEHSCFPNRMEIAVRGLKLGLISLESDLHLVSSRNQFFENY